MFNTLIKLRKYPVVGKIAYYTLKIIGLELPRNIKIGKNVKFRHWAQGTVIHFTTEIEDDVRIFQGVTIGRADVHEHYENSKMEGILIKQGAIICAGAKVLCKNGKLIVGKNTVVGANSVLLNSTGDNEIWVGVPARKVESKKVGIF